MAEKDTISKTLESYPDVFADIINGFLFDGEQVVQPDELTPADIASQYKADGKILSQERDVSKYWLGTNRFNIVAVFGLENQSGLDKFMAMRVMNYDGSMYRKQLNNKQAKADDGCYCPVITLVLYFGDRPWNYPNNLHACLDIPEKLKPYVSDYRINLLDMHHLTQGDVVKFRSDFKHIAAFYAARNESHEYVPTDAEKLNHPYEISDFFRVFRKDDRLITAYNEIVQTKEEMTMCELFDQIEARGEARGRAKGEAEGRVKGEVEGEAKMIKRLYQLGKTVKQIAELYQMPESKIEAYLAMDT